MIETEVFNESVSERQKPIVYQIVNESDKPFMKKNLRLKRRTNRMYFLTNRKFCSFLCKECKINIVLCIMLFSNVFSPPRPYLYDGTLNEFWKTVNTTNDR